MKRLSVLAMTAGLTLIASGALVQPAVAAPTTVVVKGHVRSTGGEPIGGIVFKVVQRIPGRNFVSVHGRTSATGRYEARLPKGQSYQLVVSDPGDKDADKGDGRWASSSRTVASRASTIRIDAAMAPGARLSGHVYGSTGTPVRAGLPVVAFRLGGGVPRRLITVGTTLTRSKGVYRFGNLPAGSTLIRFESGEKKVDGRYYTVQPGGALTAEAAASIVVEAGKAVTRKDFHFVPQRDPDQDLRVDGAVDPVGDAPDVLDITRYQVQNGPSDLVVTTTLPKFDPAGLDQSGSGTGNSFTGLVVRANVTGVDPKRWQNPRPNEFEVTVGPGYPGAPIDSVSFGQFTEDEFAEYPCPGLKADVRAGRITVTVPQSCFGPVTGTDAGAVTVSVGVAGNVGPQSTGDDTITSRRIPRS